MFLFNCYLLKTLFRIILHSSKSSCSTLLDGLLLLFSMILHSCKGLRPTLLECLFLLDNRKSSRPALLEGLLLLFDSRKSSRSALLEGLLVLLNILLQSRKSQRLQSRVLKVNSMLLGCNTLKSTITLGCY
jgi:hypothetical protein